jgi:hypothetical protein
MNSTSKTRGPVAMLDIRYICSQAFNQIHDSSLRFTCTEAILLMSKASDVV